MRGWLAMGLMAALGGTAQAAERRELGAHEHGHSKLNLAVEGTLVVMEIAAPGIGRAGLRAPGGDRRRTRRRWTPPRRRSPIP